MDYKITKIPFSSNKEEIFAGFSLDFKVSDFCYIDGFGIIFTCPINHCLGNIDFKGKVCFPWFGQVNKNNPRDGVENSAILNNPISVAYHPYTKECYIAEEHGKTIRHLVLCSKTIASLFGEQIRHKQRSSKHFEHVDKVRNINHKSAVGIDVDFKGDVFWSHNFLNRIYTFSRGQMKCFAGNGLYENALATNLENCSFKAPSGIACNKNIILVSDTNNFCIKKIEKNYTEIIAGNPLEQGDLEGTRYSAKLTAPSKIRSRGNIAYFIDNNKIKYLSLSDFGVGNVYETKNKIISLDIDENKDLYVLEKLEKNG